jgi:glutaminyl-peptide cyclotransferase
MTIKPIRFLLVVIVLAATIGCSKEGKDSSPEPENIPVINYQNVTSYQHDTASYTEGLLIHDGLLYESTGSPSRLPWSRSIFGPVDRTTGKIDIKVELDKNKYFGEGIASLNGKFYQLTYTTRVGFVYDAITFLQIHEFGLPGKEGWGMTTDGRSLIMSDGTNRLTFLDPETFLVTRILQVIEKGNSNIALNELEFINGHIFANRWYTNTILKIDTSSGMVTGVIDLTTLANEARSIHPGSLEMNGIAFDPVSGNILVTGKLWPKIYEIKMVESSGSPGRGTRMLSVVKNEE